VVNEAQKHGEYRRIEGKMKMEDYVLTPYLLVNGKHILKGF